MNTAREIMSKKVVSIETAISTTEIAKIMNKNNVSCIVLTQNEKPCGIITERDFLSKVIAQNKKPSDLSSIEMISSPLTTVSSFASVDDVAQTMLENKIRHVVVVDDGHPLGIITVTDFLKHLNTILLDSENYNTELYQNLFDDYQHWNN
jgi:CBS domain-containing protein